ncbi:MAG: CAP domain-containing protein, partial [Candidatus Saccharimonadales bacterium]
LLAILVAVVGLHMTYNMTTSGTVLGDRASITATALLDDTNKVREKNGLNPIALNQQLNQAAYLKAQDMFKQQYWAHTAPDGTQPWKWFADAKYNYSFAGENLAKNFYTADAATAAWMVSPEHRANILSPDYTEVGFAVMSGPLMGEEATIVVALYAAPAIESVAGVQNSQNVVAATSGGSGGVVTQLGIAVQSLTPAAIGSVILLLFAAIVAFTAHLYRQKLPKPLRQSWYRHHGAYKMAGLSSVIVVVVTLYSGGQI